MSDIYVPHSPSPSPDISSAKRENYKNHPETNRNLPNIRVKCVVPKKLLTSDLEVCCRGYVIAYPIERVNTLDFTSA
jgi:hypothetical protein